MVGDRAAVDAGIGMGEGVRIQTPGILCAESQKSARGIKKTVENRPRAAPQDAVGEN
jgi:hypothetical protein